MTDATTLLLLVVLALLAFYLIFTQRNHFMSPKSAIRTTVPGPQAVNKTDGNITDVKKAGSLHEYLMDLHEKYGPLVSFWLGEELHISVASAHLFKQMHKLFDRPFGVFKPLVDICGPTSIVFMNKEEGRNRRAVYDKCFTHRAVKPLYQYSNKYAAELVDKWSKMTSGQRIPLMDSYLTYSIRSVAVSLLGDYLIENKEFLNVSKAYDELWASVVKRMDGNESVVSAEEAQKIKSAKQLVEEAIRAALEYRVANPASAENYLLIDALHEVHSTPGPINDDAVTFFLASFHTTTSCITWTTYYIATHPEVEGKAYEEIQNVLGDEEVDWENCAKLEYLRQVVDESLRCSVLTPWGTRYQSDDDIKLDGHTIPAGTPIITAFGVAMQDKEVWPEPTKFDPDRFNATNSKERPNLAFSPFGFAGGRKCPGYRYAYSSIMTCLAHVIRRFKITLVEGQNVKPVYGLATQPAEEIWVTVEGRSPSCRKTEP